MTQLPLTLSTRAFFQTHDRAYERADENLDELTSIVRSDAKNTEDHGRVYDIVLRLFPRVCEITKILGDYAHAHAVDTRPFFPSGLGTRLGTPPSRPRQRAAERAR